MFYATIVAALRRICGMTQEDLAQESGISRRTIADFERKPEHALDQSSQAAIGEVFGRRGIRFADRGDAIIITVPKAVIAKPGKGSSD